MAKYGVEEADLSEEVLEDHDFCYHNKWEKKLLQQAISKIATDRPCYIYRHGKGSRTVYGCTCTKAEALQIQIEYEFYRALWHEELDMFLSAFIQKHKIFDMSPGHPVKEIEEDEFIRMRLMMFAMQDKPLNPMIEEKAGKQRRK